MELLGIHCVLKLLPNSHSRAYVTFTVTPTTVRTPISKLQLNSRHQQQLTINKVVIPKISSTELKVDVYLFEGKTLTSHHIAAGKSLLSSRVHPHGITYDKIDLYSKGTVQQIGFISFGYIAGTQENSNPKESALQEELSLNSSTPNQSTPNYSTLNYSALNHSSPLNRSTLKQTHISPLTYPKKTVKLMSPLNPNRTIFIPITERFKSKSALNHSIGLSHGQIEFDRQFTTHQYHITTFGRGQKQYPAIRDPAIPGVGAYKLPSIFS